MIAGKIQLAVAGAVAAVVLSWVLWTNHRISSQGDKISQYEATIDRLQSDVIVSQENYRLEVETRQAEIDKLWVTLDIHSRYLDGLRRDRARWSEIEKQVQELEGRDETLSDYLSGVARRVWPSEPTDSGAGATDLSETTGVGDSE